MFENKDKQSIGNVGDDSTVNQANGNITINNGLKAADVVSIVQALVRSELSLYQSKAEETAKQRFSDFATDLERNLAEKVADKIERFNDPAMQMSAREAALGYIKTGDLLDKESLIDMLIERVKLKENTSEQILIDEAIKIIPRLSKESLAVLTLLTYTNLILQGSKQKIDNWFKGIGDVLSVLPNVKSLDIACLLQVDCVSSLGGLMDENRWINSLRENYDTYFRKEISPDNAKPFIEKYGITINENSVIINNIPQEPRKVIGIIEMFQFKSDGSIRLNYSSTKLYQNALERIGLSSMIEDVKKLIQSGTVFSQSEIIQHMNSLDERWSMAFDILKKAPLSGYSLKPVGAYIGTRQLSKLYNREITIDIFYHS